MIPNYPETIKVFDIDWESKQLVPAKMAPGQKSFCPGVKKQEKAILVRIVLISFSGKK